MKKYISGLLLAFICCFFAVHYSSCKKADLVTTTSNQKNIYDYLAGNEKLTDFAKLVEKAGLNSYLNAYGAYTFFAPTNDALKTYLQEINKQLDQLNAEEAKTLVTLHLVPDTLTTKNFNNGKLATPTMQGQYLVAGLTFKEGASTYTINKQATITEANIKVGNGYLHVINQVIKPATLTLAKLIEQDPALSIFTQALKETGYYDTLNVANNPDTTRRYLTVIAETDKALQDSAGISSYAQLKAKYSQGNPKDPADSLNMYIRYHILPEAKYQSDLVASASHATIAPSEVILAKLEGQEVRLNYLELQNRTEYGVLLDAAKSDYSAVNGVMHHSLGHFTIKARSPYPIYWDVCETITELRKMPAKFRKANHDFAPNTLKDYKWSDLKETYILSYFVGQSAYWGDYLRIPLGFNADLRNSWAELKTPLILKGRYKVWICYRQEKQSTNNPPFPTRVMFNGQPLERFVDFAEICPRGLSTGELEAIGYKRYLANNNNTLNTGDVNVGKYVGTIDISTTDRHTIRLECAVPLNGQDRNNLDMIHFIPENMNQVKRRFKPDGGQIDIP